ncbi:tenascin-like isoform X3 [Ostrea edulis]|uniref:tenascin-like isoform X3 n=1 Tax=Ostrea edulis TaxID=37623 RepID=UPI0024AEA4D2|nr:tenascin-like isoform X3 [Ostrea edulis]
MPVGIGIFARMVEPLFPLLKVGCIVDVSARMDTLGESVKDTSHKQNSVLPITVLLLRVNMKGIVHQVQQRFRVSVHMAIKETRVKTSITVFLLPVNITERVHPVQLRSHVSVQMALSESRVETLITVFLLPVNITERVHPVQLRSPVSVQMALSESRVETLITVFLLPVNITERVHPVQLRSPVSVQMALSESRVETLITVFLLPVNITERVHPVQLRSPVSVQMALSESRVETLITVFLLPVNITERVHPVQLRSPVSVQMALSESRVETLITVFLLPVNITERVHPVQQRSHVSVQMALLETRVKSIQKRVDGSTDFYRNWDNYKTGFGDPFTNYWIGNDAIHILTTENGQELRVDLMSFTGEKVYALYSMFHVGNEASKYKFSASGFSGTAGDGFELTNGIRFSTYDQDNDSHGGVNCASVLQGAWWYSRCSSANLNGKYDATNLYWEPWDTESQIKESMMMIRPKK